MHSSFALVDDIILLFLFFIVNYLGNKNIAEKYLKKALSQTEGILGNDIIHKFNADIFENLGLVYELMNRYKDSLIFKKKKSAYRKRTI